MITFHIFQDYVKKCWDVVRKIIEKKQRRN